MPTLTRLRLERALASKQFRDGKFKNTAPLGAGLKGNPLSVIAPAVTAHPGPLTVSLGLLVALALAVPRRDVRGGYMRPLHRRAA